MKHIRLILTALLLIFWAGEASAQMARLYTSGSGLPNSQIYDIYQDSRGFIWIATENGLARFDGMDFNTFSFDRTNPNSIASDFVVTVIEDSFGTYWVGTSAGLQTFDPEYGSFTKIDLEDPTLPSSDPHITEIIEADINGKTMIIAASSGHGMYLIDPHIRKAVPELLKTLNASLTSPFIKKIFKDSQNRLWTAVEEGGVIIMDLDSCEIQENTIWKGLKANDAVITSFAQTEGGDILIGTTNYGILIYDEESGSIRRSRGANARDCKVESLLNHRLSDRFGQENILTGVENGGLKSYNTESEQLTDISIPGASFDMPSWKVHCLTEDNQGNIWVGAYQTGLMVIPKSMYGFEYIQPGVSSIPGTSGACVTSIAAGHNDGSFWVGTDGKGLYRIDRDGNTTLYSNTNSSLSNNSIMSLAIDKRGTLWVATYLGGLYSWTEKTGFRQFSDQDAIGTDKTSFLAYSEKDDILYAGTHGNGLAVISPKENKVINTLSDSYNKWISSLYIDRNGKIWIGTYNGPAVYDRKTGKATRLNVHESLSTRVYSFCESQDGKMWIGTGEGLVSFDRQENKTMSYTEKDGLPSNVIKDIQEGNDGNLWIATLNGLSRFSTTTGTFKNYYQHDGLQENEFSSKASYKALDGKLYFGGIKGITAFHPHIVDRQTHPVPPLYFSNLSVMNEPVSYDPASDENILDRHITEARQITLPFKSNIFSIKFTVLEYTNPRKIRYSYMMEGFDNDWNYTEHGTRVVSYTNLPAGRYTMKVKAFFEGAPDEFSYREIGIRILPPWFRSVWAYIMYAFLIMMMILAFMDWRKKQLVQKKEKEESEIKEMKLKMFTNLSHEIRTPLTLVMNPLKKMRESEKDPQQKEFYNLMYRNSLRILRIVNQLMDMRKVDNGQMQLHFLETDVVYFIKDIMKSFDNLAVSRNISFSINAAQEVTNLWIDQGNFDKIIFNILSNAFKHTPENGTISITISEVKKNNGSLSSQIKEYVEFVIENTGTGVDEHHLDKLFDRFFQTDVHDARVGSGVGLHLTKMLTELHHGDIRAYNTDEGMAFAIRIPTGCSHLSKEEMTKPTNHKDLYTKNISMAEEHFNSHEDVTYAPVKEDEEKPKSTKSKRSIILVDDDEEMREYLKLELKSIYNIEVCANGKEAWPKITTTIPDAIVTDLKMDMMDGAELCEKVKKNPGTNHIPVIILTSSSDENSQQRCNDSGADRFFTKPISLEILKSAIANAISTRDTIRNKYNKEIDYKYSEIKMPDSSNKLVSKVIETIRKNMENSNFSVEDLSREVGMSRVHLNRKLKETMNVSPSNLIRSIRLKQAAYLLINNKVNISEVAYKVGFSTHSYFSNSFHDFFGMTPKEFVAKYMDCKDEETLKRIFE